MNRYFSSYDGKEFPRRSYAKIDSVEPPGPGGDDIVIAFDAVDANWELFDQLKSVGRDDGYLESEVRRFWKNRFGKSGHEFDDAFDRMPLYRIELSLPRSHPWLREFPVVEDVWLEIELDTSGEAEVDVFPSLFAPPVIAYVQHPPKVSPLAASLNVVFDTSVWRDASAADLNALLVDPCDIEALVALDVGQGSAMGIYCAHGAKYYFDVGCGANGNAKTRPSVLHFCDCVRPPIILSHWDADHWAGAVADKSLLSHDWIVPRQSLRPSHIAFANSILGAGGSISIFPAGLSPFSWAGGGATCTIYQCTGSTINGSGLALAVTQTATGLSWLLTGDAGYAEIPVGPLQLTVVTVPHHGADMTHVGSAPSPARQKYRRAIYSFGPGNKFGKTHVQHPVSVTVADHENATWRQGTWAGLATPAMGIAGQDTLATATHQKGHNAGAAVGFKAPPALPLHTCAKSMPVMQT